MAAFASGHRSTSIRFFIVLLVLIMAFASVALPVYALSESVALFGLAAVLSSATAALGFKLTNNQQGIDTINRMCADFVKSALAPALVVIGTKANGLQNDMAYIKMQVANAKTYLDERVLAWVQQWLGKNGVFNKIELVSRKVSSNNLTFTPVNSVISQIVSLVNPYHNIICNNQDFNSALSYCKYTFPEYDDADFFFLSCFGLRDYTKDDYYLQYMIIPYKVKPNISLDMYLSTYGNDIVLCTDTIFTSSPGQIYYRVYTDGTVKKIHQQSFNQVKTFSVYKNDVSDAAGTNINPLSMGLSLNNTGLSGQDTIGEDYKDKTLEQILQGLKDHAPDWYDAGADSSTNSTVGAKDLPVTVPAGAATENPALNPDAVYNPPFDQPLDDSRSGATSSTTVADGVTNANTAESSEATAATVAETQTIIDSLINWANNYISPDKGLFSKFPLCIPYDAYLLVSSALGVDARDISDIVNTEQSDLSNLSYDIPAVNPQSDFVPVVDIQHDLELDGHIYPIRISFDLTPIESLIKLNRTFLSIALIAELIGSEYKRIRGEK